MKKFKIALVTLLIATIALIVVNTYCYVKANETEAPMSGLGFWAEEIEKPDRYWVLTSPDSWTLEAIENPEKTVYCYGEDVTKQTFTYQVAQNGGVRNVEYQGKYYHILYAWFDAVPPEIIDQPYKQNYGKIVSYSPIGFGVLAALWAVLGAVWLKAGKKNFPSSFSV